MLPLNPSQSIKYFASDDGIKELSKKREALNKTLLDGLENPIYETKQLTRKGKESGFTLDEVMAGRTQDGKIIDDAASLMEDGFTLKFGNITDDAFESFSKELVERQKKRNGPIFSLKEELGEYFPNIKYELYSESFWANQQIPFQIRETYSLDIRLNYNPYLQSWKDRPCFHDCFLRKIHPYPHKYLPECVSNNPVQLFLILSH